MNTLNINYCVENQKDFPKLSLFASWPGSMINPQWLELPISRTNFHGPKDIRAIKVRLYNRNIARCFDSYHSFYLYLQKRHLLFNKRYIFLYFFLNFARTFKNCVTMNIRQVMGVSFLLGVLYGNHFGPFRPFASCSGLSTRISIH